jgi:hypothetical protein
MSIRRHENTREDNLVRSLHLYTVNVEIVVYGLRAVQKYHAYGSKVQVNVSASKHNTTIVPTANEPVVIKTLDWYQNVPQYDQSSHI